MNEKKKYPCCVPICKGERFDLVHKFPRINERALKWLQMIGCPKLKTIPLQKLSQMYQVCSRHFRIEDYKHALSRGLNMNAIPSLNLKDLSQLHVCKNSTPRDYKNQDRIIIKELSEQNSCNEMKQRKSFDNEEFECVEMIPIEDVQEKLIEEHRSGQTLGHIPAEKEILKPVIYSIISDFSQSSSENKLLLNSFWLRCHCRCFACYDSINFRSKISPMDISSGIQPKSVEQLDGMDVISIEWDDDHKSEYDVNFLMTSSSEINEEACTFPRIPWYRDSDDVQEFTSIDFNRLIGSDKKVNALFQNLSINGVAIVKNIPTENKTMAKLTLSHLFPQLETIHFENFNEIHSDICTNFTYSNADCGLKCFFITEEEEITLVDGLNVAQELKASNTRAFKKLSHLTVPIEISEPNVMWRITAPIIEINPETKEIFHLRLDVHRLGVLNTLPQERVQEFYGSLKEFIKIIGNKKNQWVLSLHPGTMLLLDNWRIFHKFSDNSGISQCYLERKEFISRVRYLGLT